MKIRTKLFIFIAALLAILVFAAYLLSYVYSPKIIEDRIASQMDSIITLKENQIENYFGEKIKDIRSVINETYYSDKSLYMSNITFDIEENKIIREKLTGKLSNDEDFEEFFVIDMTGKIILSTDESQEGKNKANENYFINRQQDHFIQAFYYDLAIQNPSTIISSPIKDSQGNIIRIFGARLNTDNINKIMLEKSGLGETGETYLVNRFYYLVTESRFLKDARYKNTIYTEATMNCMNGTSDYAHYNDYRGVPVFGAYKWDNDLKICILAEIDQSEALRFVKNLRNIIFIMLIIAVFLISVGGLIFSKTITSQIDIFAIATKEFSEGNLDYKIEMPSTDEFHNLGELFNKMALDLKFSKIALEDYSQNLEKQVEDRTAELEEKIYELSKNKAALLNIMEDLRESMDKQKQLEKVKTEFLSVTSHELRTPITPMKAQLQMVLGEYFGKLSPEQKKSLDMVLRNAVRLDHLIGDILDISKLQSGAMKFIFEKVNMNKIIDNVSETMSLKANEKNIKLELVEKDLPEIIGDSDRLTQVLVNLVNNAIKFTDPNGIIQVKSENKNDQIVVSVKDNGIGISKEDQKRLFTPFVQVDSSHSRKYEGSGLGLAICKGIILRHGGKIWIESDLGKGSEFIFTIPITTKIPEGEKEVELFIFNKDSIITSFKKKIDSEGYAIVEEKMDELINENILKEDGSLRYDLSYKELEKKGYIFKRN